MNVPKQNVLFGIPKKGRLNEQCEKLLRGAGLEWVRPNRLDVANCKEVPITIVFLPAADIAKYVSQGNVDIGITGQDVCEESGVDIDEVIKLGFGGCKLCLQAPIKSSSDDPKEFVGKRIVTSFPNLAKKYFDNLAGPGGPQTHIQYVSGSVEAACGLGLADAVVDLVETGTTMRAAGLEIVSEVLRTEAVIIRNKANMSAERKKVVDFTLKRIQGYMTATSFMLISYNVSKAFLDKVISITPGKRAPTVSALDVQPGLEPAFAVSALIPRKQAPSIMDDLEVAGATDILLFPVSNSRM